METNETHTHKPEYSQKTVTSQTGGSNADSLAQFEQLKNMICSEVAKERDEWKNKYERLKIINNEKDERINNLERINIDKDLNIQKLKKELTELQETFKAEENNKIPTNDYVFDLSDFFKDAKPKDVIYLLDCLFNLTQIKLKPECYLINNASDIVPIYIVLTQDSKLENTIGQFCGTLKDFCGYWNANIIPRINDDKRAKALTCNYLSVKATINKEPWKNSNPVSWRRLASEALKKKKHYKLAFNIKERLEDMISKRHFA